MCCLQWKMRWNFNGLRAFLEFINFINLHITKTFSIEMSFLQALKVLQLVLSPMENEMAFLKFMNFINLQIPQTFSIEMSFLQALKGLQFVLSPMENEMNISSNFTSLLRIYELDYLTSKLHRPFLLKCLFYRR